MRLKKCNLFFEGDNFVFKVANVGGGVLALGSRLNNVIAGLYPAEFVHQVAACNNQRGYYSARRPGAHQPVPL